MSKFCPELVLPSDIEPPRFFSPLAETQVGKSGNLPHWEQRNKTVFVTFRLADSLPAEKLAQWAEEEFAWRAVHPGDWDSATQREYDHLFPARLEAWLDAGHGECLLKDPALREAVEKILMNHDGISYRLYAAVVKPNHLHACFTPLGDNSVQTIVQAWKSISAHAICKALQRKGPIWQKEYFDRYIRNGEHFTRVVRYIVRNDPAKAWVAGEWG